MPMRVARLKWGTTTIGGIAETSRLQRILKEAGTMREKSSLSLKCPAKSVRNSTQIRAKNPKSIKKRDKKGFEQVFRAFSDRNELAILDDRRQGGARPSLREKAISKHMKPRQKADTAEATTAKRSHPKTQRFHFATPNFDLSTVTTMCIFRVEFRNLRRSVHDQFLA